MIFLDSVGSVVNKAGTMYPALASVDSKYTLEPDLDQGISMTDPELNCEVYKNMSWSDREFLRKFVGDDLFKEMERNSKTNSINDNFVWTTEDQLNADLIEATDGMRGL